MRTMTANDMLRSRSPTPLDLPAVKTRQRAARSAGNYAIIGTTLQIVAEQLCEALDLHSGERVLDIAAATATCHSPPRAAGAMSSGSTMSHRGSGTHAGAPRPNKSRSSFGREMRRRSTFRTPISTSWRPLSV